MYHAQKDPTPIEAFVSTIYILLDIILIPILLFILYLKEPMGILYGVILSATFTLIGDVLINTMRGIYYTSFLPDVLYNLDYMVLLFAMYDAYRKNVEIITVEDIDRGWLNF